MTVDDTAPAVAIWRNGRVQRGRARRDRILSADAATRLSTRAILMCAAGSWQRKRVSGGIR